MQLRQNAGGKGEPFINFSVLKQMLLKREGGLKALQSQANCGRMLTVDKGYLVCPYCRKNRKVKRITPDERGERVLLYCRDCKREFRVDIEQGQCFESRSR